MANELTYVLINPYTIAKSRTGGVLARYIGRSDLRFVAARLFGPSEEMARRYAELLRRASPEQPDTRQLLADYVERNYVPNPVNGRPRRVMMLLFEGEDAIRRMYGVALDPRFLARQVGFLFSGRRRDAQFLFSYGWRALRRVRNHVYNLTRAHRE